MKKIFLLLAIFLLVSAPVFAAALTPDSTKAAAGATLETINSAANVTNFMKFSKGVYGGAQTSSTGYALTTAHTSGSKYYGTGWDATALYVQDAGGVVAATLAAPTSSTADEAFPDADWTKL